MSLRKINIDDLRVRETSETAMMNRLVRCMNDE